jgi:hypothetical protein
MLDILGRSTSRFCDGRSRRSFLKVGTLGLGTLGLPDLLRVRAAARDQGGEIKDTSVIWLWLGGGPPHIETFDPKMTAPVDRVSRQNRKWPSSRKTWSQTKSSAQALTALTTSTRAESVCAQNAAVVVETVPTSRAIIASLLAPEYLFDMRRAVPDD